MKKIFMRTVISISCLVGWPAVVFIVTLSGSLRQPITKKKNVSSFMAAADREIEKDFVGNLAMVTFSDSEIEAEKFYSAGAPVNNQTVFQVASLSKWVSAFGILKLADAGKIHLDSPVMKYVTRWQLPQSKFNNNDVTVRRLLSHTAGLTDGLGYSGFENENEIQTLEASLTRAADADEGTSGVVAVGMRPGSKFKYSGGGYTLLQLMVEEVTGTSFATYMRDSVLIPLGMTSSGYIWNDTSSLKLAEFYHDNGSRAKHYHYTSKAATSLYTTLTDLTKFFQAHFEGPESEPIGRGVLKPETVKLMRTPHAKTWGFDIWGLGTVLYATTAANDFIIGHDGKSTPAINSAVRLNPITGDGIIVLTTGHPYLATKLASEWVFWKTGQIDTMLFPTLMEGMLTNTALGWVVLIGIAVALSFRKKSSL